MVAHKRLVWVLIGLSLIYRKNVVYCRKSSTDQSLSTHTTHPNGQLANVSGPLIPQAPQFSVYGSGELAKASLAYPNKSPSPAGTKEDAFQLKYAHGARKVAANRPHTADEDGLGSYKEVSQPGGTGSTGHYSSVFTHSQRIIELDIGYNGPTTGYTVSIQGSKKIFRANSPYLFGKVRCGDQALWSCNNNRYPNKVVYKVVNGENHLKVFFPAEQTTEPPYTLESEPGAKPPASKGVFERNVTSSGQAGGIQIPTEGLNIQIPTRGSARRSPFVTPDVSGKVNQSYISLSIPSAPDARVGSAVTFSASPLKPGSGMFQPQHKPVQPMASVVPQPTKPQSGIYFASFMPGVSMQQQPFMYGQSIPQGPVAFELGLLQSLSSQVTVPKSHEMPVKPQSMDVAVPQMPLPTSTPPPKIADQTHGSQSGGSTLVTIDLDLFQSTAHVAYSYDSAKNTHTFKTKDGALIEKVTRDGMATWEATDGRYANKLVVTIDSDGNITPKMFYPASVFGDRTTSQQVSVQSPTPAQPAQAGQAVVDKTPQSAKSVILVSDSEDEVDVVVSTKARPAQKDTATSLDADVKGDAPLTSQGAQTPAFVLTDSDEEDVVVSKPTRPVQEDSAIAPDTEYADDSVPTTEPAQKSISIDTDTDKDGVDKDQDDSVTESPLVEAPTTLDSSVQSDSVPEAPSSAPATEDPSASSATKQPIAADATEPEGTAKNQEQESEETTGTGSDADQLAPFSEEKEQNGENEQASAPAVDAQDEKENKTEEEQSDAKEEEKQETEVPNDQSADSNSGVVTGGLTADQDESSTVVIIEEANEAGDDTAKKEEYEDQDASTAAEEDTEASASEAEAEEGGTDPRTASAEPDDDIITILAICNLNNSNNNSNFINFNNSNNSRHHRSRSGKHAHSRSHRYHEPHRPHQPHQPHQHHQAPQAYQAHQPYSPPQDYHHSSHRHSHHSSHHHRSASRQQRRPSSNFIDLDIEYSGPTIGYSLTIEGQKKIFTSIEPYLFRKVLKGSRTIRQFHDEYPNQIYCEYVNGRHKFKAFFPDQQLSDPRAQPIRPSWAESEPSASSSDEARRGAGLPWAAPTYADVHPANYAQQPFYQPPPPDAYYDQQFAPVPATSPPKISTRLSLFIQDPHDARKSLKLNPALYASSDPTDHRLASYTFDPSVKCTEVVFADLRIWKFDPSKPSVFPRSISWNESYYLIILDLDDCYKLFTKLKMFPNWRRRTLAKNEVLNTKLIHIRSAMSPASSDSSLFEFRNLGFGYEFVFSNDAKIEKLCYDEKPVYTHDTHHDRGRHPKILYLFTDKSGQVIYNGSSFFLYPPDAVFLDIKHDFKTTDRFYCHLPYLYWRNVTYVPKPGYRFSRVVTKAGVCGCNFSTCGICNRSLIIWDGSFSSLYATRVVFNGLNRRKKKVTIFLSNGTIKAFEKKGKNKPWRDIASADVVS